MAEWTITVRAICESLAGNTVSDVSNFQSVISTAAPKVFNFDFPIFDELHRQELEEKILLWYYDREIGFRTVGRWQLGLAQYLNRIMPYYNEMYKTTSVSYDMLNDVDLTESYSHTSQGGEEQKSGRESIGSSTSSQNGTDTTSSNSSGNTTSATSDTPQGTISDVDNYSYLTSYNKSTSSSQNGGTVKSNITNVTDNSATEYGVSTKNDTRKDNYQKTTSGKSGGKSYPEMIMEYRKAIANVDSMIIDELEDLFLSVWTVDSII